LIRSKKDQSDTQTNKNGAEDLLSVAVHGGGDVSQNGGSHEVAVGVSRDLDVATVQDQLSPVSLFDEMINSDTLAP
jgi:hypothetical protein